MRSLFIGILFFLLTISSASLLSKNYVFDTPKINSVNAPNLGTCDFVAYWGAAQCLLQGQNPYSLTNMYEAQKSGGFAYKKAHPFMNPPWALTVLIPLLGSSFLIGTTIWMFYSAALISIAVMLVWDAENGDKKLTPFVIAASLFFYPFIETIFWGQFGAITTLGVCGFYWSYKKERQYLMGLFLFLISMKPHVLYLFILVLGFWLLKTRRLKTIFSAAILLLFSIVTVEMIAPGSNISWLESINSSSSIKLTRASSSIPGLVRILINDGHSIPPNWPIMYIPLIGVLFGIALLIKRKGVPNWSFDLPVLLCLGFLFTPHVWTHDFTPLVMIVPLVLARQKTHSKAKKTAILLILVQASCLALTFIFKSPSVEYFWFPLLMLYISFRYLSRTNLKTT